MPIRIVKGTAKSKRHLLFSDLTHGDIFTSEGDRWFMKTYDMYDCCDNLTGNAICLSTGIPHLFDDDYTISKLNKDFEIEYSNDDVLTYI